MLLHRVFILAGIAVLLCSVSSHAVSRDATVIARLEEESIPAAELSVSPTPTASPEPGGATSPGATPTSTPYASDVFKEPTPIPNSADQLPPLEAGSITPSLRISDSSLNAAIEQEQNPARAAAMRIVEQARGELMGGHPDEAIRTLARAVSIDPSDPYAYFYLGRAYIVKQNYTQAMTFLKRAEIGFGSRNPVWLSETLAFEGIAYEESGRDTAAAAAYQQALQANPGNLMARVGYTRLAPTITPEAPEGAPSTDADLPPPGAEEPPPPPDEAPPPPAPGEAPARTD